MVTPTSYTVGYRAISKELLISKNSGNPITNIMVISKNSGNPITNIMVIRKKSVFWLIKCHSCHQ